MRVNPFKLMLFGIGALIGLAAIVAAALLLILDTPCKSGLESVASGVLGMEVGVGDRSRIDIFPGLHVTLEDVSIRNQRTEVASAEEANLEIDILPLLGANLRLGRIALKGPRISIERDPDGRLNLERSRGRKGMELALGLDDLSVSDGVLHYVDRQSEREFEAEGCDLALRHLRFSKDRIQDLPKGLSFAGELACGMVRTRGFAMTDLGLSVDAKAGVFEFAPLSAQVFGGEGSGAIHVDYSGAVPAFKLDYFIEEFRIEEFLKGLSPDSSADGTADFSTHMSLQGGAWDEIARSASGEISVRGENLMLRGNDLDQQLSQYESSQNFNLIDAGAFLFAGPLGLAVTKGYGFSSLFRGTGGNTQIRTLVSDWKVEHGIAQAMDVAMATAQNRIALSGRLDLVNQQFDAVTVALIDDEGCSRVQQTIRGPFREPVVERPSVLMAMSGPARNLFKWGGSLFPGKRCEVFYAGSVAPQEQRLR